MPGACRLYQTPSWFRWAVQLEREVVITRRHTLDGESSVRREFDEVVVERLRIGLTILRLQPGAVPAVSPGESLGGQRGRRFDAVPELEQVVQRVVQGNDMLGRSCQSDAP